MRKKILRSGFAGVMVLFLTIAFFRHDEKKQLEELVHNLVQATFIGDTESILTLFPEKMSERVLSDTGASFGLREESLLVERLGKKLSGWIDIFNRQLGEGWTYEYKIERMYRYNVKERQELRALYQLMGVEDFKIGGASLVLVSYTLHGMNGQMGTNQIPVCLIRQGRNWFLGQGIGAVYLEAVKTVPYELYGDLMDGFTITGIEGDAEEYLTEIVPRDELADTERKEISVP